MNHSTEMCYVIFVNFLKTAFPHIVSSREIFPPLDSVRGQNLLIIYIQCKTINECEYGVFFIKSEIFIFIT